MKLNKKLVLNKLKDVLDPEISISIVDLGLIYQVELNNNKVNLTMTLTSIGCPLYSMIEQEIKDKLVELGLKEKNIKIKLVFNPPWTMDKMSKKGKKMLGI